MIAQQDEEMFEWLKNASRNGGSFLCSLALAALCADAENYPILRPALLVFLNKYPKYAGGGEMAKRA